MQLSSQFLVRLLEMINLRLGLRDGPKQLAVCSLTRHEFRDHLLNVGYLCRSLYVLEGLVDLCRVAHLFLHTLAHVSIPELLAVEILAHLKFR